MVTRERTAPAKPHRRERVRAPKPKPLHDHLYKRGKPHITLCGLPIPCDAKRSKWDHLPTCPDCERIARAGK